jgi:type II secretory pathway component GspD/PulD (secretin)
MLRPALLAVLLLPLACQSSSPAPAEPAAGVSSEEQLLISVVRLEHARAEELTPLLADILYDKCSGRPWAIRPEAQPAATVAEPQFKVVAQAATNSLIVSGTKQQIAECLELIAKLDVPEEPGSQPAPR